MKHSWLVKAALALVVPGMFLLSSAAPAQAHAILIRSDPPQNARLIGTPKQIVLFFSEALDRPLSTVHLLDSAGHQQPTSSPQFGNDPTEMSVTVTSTLPPGYYTVSWVTVSAVDGHRWSGTFPITILNPDGSLPPGRPPAIAGNAMPNFSPLDAVVRWVLLLGLIGVAGGFGFASLVLWPSLRLLSPTCRESGQRWILRLAGRVALLSAIAALLANGGVFVRQAEQAGSLVVLGATTLGGRFGAVWLARTGLLIIAAALAWAVVRESARLCVRQNVAVLLICGLLVSLGMLVTMSLTSHAAAERGAAWGVPSDLVHLIGIALWLGGLVQLPVLIRGPALSPIEEQIGFQLAGLRRFSTLAAGCVSAVLFTGLFNLLVQVPSSSALLATAYGQTLLIKIALSVPLFGLGLLNATWASSCDRSFSSIGLNRQEVGRFLRRATAESVAGALVLAATAVLVNFVPATTVAAQNAARVSNQPTPAFQQTTKAADLTVAVSITPNQVGENTFYVQLTGLDLDKIERVQLRFLRLGSQVGRSTLDAQQVPNDAGLFTAAGANLSLAGRWQITVNVRRRGHDDVDAVITDPLSGPSGDRSPTAFPAHGIAPIAAWLALAVLVVWLLLLFWRPRVRRPPMLLGSVAPALFLLAALLVAAGHKGSASLTERTAIVAPEQTGVAQSWRLPTASAGLMMPALGPDGWVWVGEMNANKLAVFDPAANRYHEFTLPGSQLAGVMGVAVDARGRVWLALDGASAIGMFDPATRRYEELPTPTPNSGPSGIAIDSRGRVWFTELSAKKIGMYDPATRLFREYPLPAANVNPYWLSIAPNGQVWFTNIGGGTIGVLAPETGHADLIDVQGARGTTGIAIDQGGMVWFATSSGQLGRLDPASRQVQLMPAPSGQLYGVAVDARGTVWLATAQASVVAYDPYTAQFHTYATGPGAWWVVAAPDGAIWIAEATLQYEALGRIASASAAQTNRVPEEATARTSDVARLAPLHWSHARAQCFASTPFAHRRSSTVALSRPFCSAERTAGRPHRRRRGAAVCCPRCGRTSRAGAGTGRCC